MDNYCRTKENRPAQLLAGQTSNLQPSVVWLDDVRPEQIAWLWPNRIPLGSLTLLLGDPGLGKSFLTLYIAAQVSTGGPWPDATHAPKGSACILSAEDSLPHVICPRLRNLGADLTRINAIEAVRSTDGPPALSTYHFNINRDIAALKHVLQSTGDIRLIIIDPLSAYLGCADSYNNAAVRAALLPLDQLARRYNIAVLAVTHLNKNTSARAAYRPLGSLAYLAAARTAWLVSTDPDDPAGRRRLLTPLKHNLLAEPTSLAFQISDGRLIFEPNPFTTTADHATCLSRRSGLATKPDRSPQTDRAIDWLKTILPPGQSLPSTEILRLAHAAGIKKDTLKKAKKRLNVTSHQSRVADTSAWSWRLD